MIRKCFLCACLLAYNCAFPMQSSKNVSNCASGNRIYAQAFEKEVSKLIGQDLAKVLTRVKQEIESLESPQEKDGLIHFNAASTEDQCLIEEYSKLMKTDIQHCSFTIYDYKPFYKFGDQDYYDFNLDIRNALSCGVYASGLCLMCPQTSAQFCYDLCSVRGVYPSDESVLQIIKRNIRRLRGIAYGENSERKLDSRINSDKFCDFGLSEDIKGYICFALRYTYHCGFWGCDFLQTFIWLFAALGNNNICEKSIIQGVNDDGYDLVFTQVPWITSNSAMTNAQRFLVAMFGSIASSYASNHAKYYSLANKVKRSSYLYSIWLAYSQLPQWTVISLLGHEFDSFVRDERIKAQPNLDNGLMVLKNKYTGASIKENRPGEFFLSQQEVLSTLTKKKSEKDYCINDIAMYELLNTYLEDSKKELSEIESSMRARIKRLNVLHENKTNKLAENFINELEGRFEKIRKSASRFCILGALHSSFYDIQSIAKLIRNDPYIFNTVFKARLDIIIKYASYISSLRLLDAHYDLNNFKGIDVGKFISMEQKDFIFKARRCIYTNYFDEYCGWGYVISLDDQALIDKTSMEEANDEKYLNWLEPYLRKAAFNVDLMLRYDRTVDLFW